MAKHNINIKPKTNPQSHIPAGEYEAKCTGYEIKRYLGKEKRLYLKFKVNNWEWFETEFFAAYNFTYKSFPRACKYYTDWSIANGRLPSRKDRMSPKVFLNKVFIVKVRSVQPKYDDGTPKPEMFRYSIVDRIIMQCTDV